MKKINQIIDIILKSKKRYMLFTVSAVLLSFGLMKYFYVNNVKIICPLMIFALVFLTEFCLRIKNKTVYINALFFSLFLAASFIVGDKVDVTNKVINYFYLRDIAYYAILFVCSFLIVSNLLRFAVNNRIDITKNKTVLPKWVFIACAVLIVLCWTPYFLTYYPACLSVDSYDQIEQALGLAQMSNHHPILYTLFVRLFVNIGLKLFKDITFGVALTAFMQMLILSTVYAYFINWLYRKNCGSFAAVGSFIFFALNPYIAFYAITLWKDVLFSAVILLLCMRIYDIVTDYRPLRKAKDIPGFVILCLLTVFLRNNGIYICVISGVILLIKKRADRKVLTAAVVFIILFTYIIQGPVYTLCNIKPSETEEALAIPLQQIGYTLNNGGTVTPKQYEFIEKLLPVKTYAGVYDPLLADKVKFNEEFNADFLNQNKVMFVKVWLEMMIPNFGMYIKAYIMQTLGFWNIGTTNWTVIKGSEDNEFGIKAENLMLKYFKKDMHTSLYYETDLLKTKPFLGNIFSAAYLAWIGFFYIAVMNCLNKSKKNAAISPLIILWVSVMAATPVFCEFRYVYAYFTCLPFMVITMFLDEPPADPSAALPF